MAVIYETAATLNGFLATEDDSLDWLFEIPGEQPDLKPSMESATALVMGSTTYEWGEIWMMGGGGLAAQFLAAGALDRIALTMAPVTLAAGKPLFSGDVTWDRLRLRSAEKIGEWARLVYDVTPLTA